MGQLSCSSSRKGESLTDRNDLTYDLIDHLLVGVHLYVAGLNLAYLAVAHLGAHLLTHHGHRHVHGFGVSMSRYGHRAHHH